MPQPSPAGKAFAGMRALVIGLGRFGGGVGVTRWLAEQGATVTVMDRADESSLTASVEALDGLPVTFRLGREDPSLLTATDLAVVNPAINKRRSALFQTLIDRQIPWTTEMNLFCERCPGRVIGVTGSYGKSTTCAMLRDALEACRQAGRVEYTAVHLGGNFGGSLLGDLQHIHPDHLVVLEMSNAQLEDLPRIRWAPPLALITNLHPHHLDRYERFEAYIDAKLNIVRDPQNRSTVIVGPIDPPADAMLARAVPYAHQRVRPVRPLPSDVAIRAPGDHNRHNAACAMTLCHTLALNPSIVARALAAFRGLPHRLEFVATVAGADYYNDSKSTCPAATAAAVRAFTRPLVAIVGGQHHEEASLSDLAGVLKERCRTVVCTGESGPHLTRALRTANRRDSAGPASPAILSATTLPDAVACARKHARAGDVVLFSPAAPSFDAYLNFAQRGEHFVEIVRGIR